MYTRPNPSNSGDAMWCIPIPSNQSPSQTQHLQNQVTQLLHNSSYPNNTHSMMYSPPAPFNESPDPDIYHKAISVSSPRLASVEGEIDPNTLIKKKIIRRVEVPFTRQVKVPTQTVQLVPTTVETRVPVKKLVQVPGYQTVNETYTEFEEREAIREKEIWVKKIVPEKYVERVPIQKIRQVQKPTTLVKEVDSFEVVCVPTTKKVLVDGYRVDEVEDAKMVEVEEFQNYDLCQQPVGESVIASTRDLGRIPHSHLSRTIGHQIYHPQHPGIRDIDLDSDVNQPNNSLHSSSLPHNQAPFTNNNRGPFSSTGAGIVGGLSAPRPGSRSQLYSNQPSSTSTNPHSVYRPSTPTGRNLNLHSTNSSSPLYNQYGQPNGMNLVGNGYVNANEYPTAGAYKKPPSHSNSFGSSSSTLDPSQLRSSYGLSVDETHTRHTDGTGVLVAAIDRGTTAAKAGLQSNDIITSVGGRPVNSVYEFAQILSRFTGPVQITVNRDGRRNIGLIFSK